MRLAALTDGAPPPVDGKMRRRRVNCQTMLQTRTSDRRPSPAPAPRCGGHGRGPGKSTRGGVGGPGCDGQGPCADHARSLGPRQRARASAEHATAAMTAPGQPPPSAHPEDPLGQGRARCQCTLGEHAHCQCGRPPRLAARCAPGPAPAPPQQDPQVNPRGHWQPKHARALTRSHTHVSGTHTHTHKRVFPSSFFTRRAL